MSSVSAAKSMTNALSAAIVASDKLPRTKVWGETDSAVSWQGAFAVYGGNGTTASSAIVYEVEPAKRLGWHTDATEETQYIIAGQALSRRRNHAPSRPRQRVRAADADAHDLENIGKETLRAVAFFAAAMFTQDFDQVMLPPKSHILGTPNREG